MQSPQADGLRARVLARTIVFDILLYNGERVAAGATDEEVFAVLSDVIEEGREAFAKHAPEHLDAYDDCLTLLPFQARLRSIGGGAAPVIDQEGLARRLAQWIAEDIWLMDDPNEFKARVGAWEGRFAAR